MKITVKIYEAGSLLIEKLFDDGVYRVGRSEFADINLPSDTISRSHFELRVTASNVYLTNMSSGGRIKVNGKQIETGEVKDGDEIVVGPYSIIVSFGDSVGQSDEPVPGESQIVPEPQMMSEESPQGEAQAAELPLGEVQLDANGNPDNMAPANPEPAVAGTSSSPFARALSADVEGTAALNRAETVVEAKPVVAKLVFVEGPRKGDELFIEAYEISLGRSKKADIFLDDERLSRIHAKISRVGMGFRLIDQQSRNGTYVNGMRVLEHPLASFDTIEIGGTKIRFLIHDMVAGDLNRMGRTSLMESPLQRAAAVEQTRSLQVGADQKDLFLDLPRSIPPLPKEPGLGDTVALPKERSKPNTRIIILGIALAGLIALFYFMSNPNGKPVVPDDKKPVPVGVETKNDTKVAVPTNLPSSQSKQFLELSPELQREVEGAYNTALRAADREMWQEALDNLQKIHDLIPQYKESVSLKERYTQQLKAKQAREAIEKSKRDDKESLQQLLDDGIAYLKDRDFEKAAEAFNAAVQLDLDNKIAKKGLRAADLRIDDISKVPPERDPIKERKDVINGLFQKALQALEQSRYQEAILTAEDIRKIELPGESGYLNEAKQIIDKARMKQKEEFEPFLIDAKGKYAEGQFKESRELCEEMLKKDPSFSEAKECALKAKKQLNKLAKESYQQGYILESMNRIEEAKQNWNRAKNYVQPGDEYYDKVMRMLDKYQ